MTDTCGSTDTADGEPCERQIPDDDDRCHLHSEGGPPDGHGAPEGNDNALGNAGGRPPEGNDNAARHELFTDRDIYYQRLDGDRQTWVFDMTHAILDRLRAVQGGIDLVDKELAKNIAIDMDKVATANAHISREGLLQDLVVPGDGPEGPMVVENAKQHTILKELRLHNESIEKRLRRLGVLEDPVSQNADATRSLAELLSEANREHIHE